MKTILISSAVSIAIGFTFGWMIRSATVDLDSIENTITTAPNPKRITPKVHDPLDIPPDQINPSDIDRVMSPNRNIPEGNAKPPESAEKAEQAKWSRLIEVLGLDKTQAKVLEAAIAESDPVPAEGQQLDASYVAAGEKLQAKILSVLNEDQQKAFKELQERSLKNQLHAKSMQQYVQELGKFDLDASQADQAMAVLMKHAEGEASAIPAGTRLLLDGSVLPIGDRKFSDDAFSLLGKISASNTGGAMSIEEIAAIHRAEMERRMNQFEGILSPAQMQRYQAGIMESSENLDLLAPQN